PEIYKTEESIKDLASQFILIAAAVMPLCAFSHSAYFTLRSGGKTGVTFLFDSVYTWVIVVPFAFYLARYTMLPVTLVVFLVQFTEIIKVTIGFFMVRSNVWLNNIVSEK
ncbi:MAG: MATE family efflux transporter, partial [Lachnospiraceae bacterium]|nr:MATE family efflux transporter [Lachnospiraceae bacterium]